ncbi:holin [Companilactobacillus ginsenosidimutans]|uniref:holin n=1 Tax=Companilactobacillus ginsenosidimutans TaxID=1007676 RepID=UPI000661301B|nr:holin [Companilactobacillus ginsenosidimutans]
MDYILGLNLISAGELTLIGVAVYAITQAIKISKIKLANKYLPFVSMILGVLIGLFVGFMQNDSSLYQSGFAGFLVGASTAGLFTGFKGVAGGYSTEWKPTKEQKNLDMKG